MIFTDGKCLQAWLWRLLSYASFSEEAFDKVIDLALQEDDK